MNGVKVAEGVLHGIVHTTSGPLRVPDFELSLIQEMTSIFLVKANMSFNSGDRILMEHTVTVLTT